MSKNIFQKATLFIALSTGTFFGAKISHATDMVKIDGSSTVYPIIEAVSEEFSKAYPKVRVTAGVSGTGGGFKKFISGEIDICNASRPAKKEELKGLSAKGIQFHQLKIGYDGLSIIINPANKFVDFLSIAELKKLWDVGSKVKTWADLRKGWPASAIKLYGPGTDSGTFDFFTEAINGKAQQSRSDFTKSEDDNVLVQGVAGDRDALAYIGHAYVEANKTSLKVVPIGNSKAAAILPNHETIKSGKYSPLSRPLFIYVADSSLKKPEVKRFVTFLLDKAEALVSEVGYVSLEKKEYEAQAATLSK